MTFYGVWTVAVLVEAVIRVRHEDRANSKDNRREALRR